MTFRPGLEGLLDSPPLMRSGAWFTPVNDDGSAIHRIAHDEKWRKLIEDGIPGSISGERHGFVFHVFEVTVGRGRRSRPGTRVVLLFKRPYSHGMKITRKNAVARVLAGKGRLAIPGNPLLNRMLRVSGRDGEEILLLLSRREVQEGLSRFFFRFPSGVINDEGISLTLESGRGPGSELPGIMESLAELGELFY